MIVTTLDTFTSLLGGFTIFGILGNLAYNVGEDDISKVLKNGGSALAFISYPDAISKFTFVPQVMNSSSLFFKHVKVFCFSCFQFCSSSCCLCLELEVQSDFKEALSQTYLIFFLNSSTGKWREFALLAAFLSD